MSRHAWEPCKVRAAREDKRRSATGFRGQLMELRYETGRLDRHSPQKHPPVLLTASRFCFSTIFLASPGQNSLRYQESPHAAQID